MTSSSKMRVEKIGEKQLNNQNKYYCTKTSSNGNLVMGKMSEKQINNNKGEIMPVVGLPSKVFVPRNSLLTDLWESSHLQTQFNMIYAALIAILLHTVLFNYVYLHRIDFVLNIFKRGFPTPFLMIFFWCGLFLASFVPYYGLLLWATVRIHLNKESNFKFLDELMIGCFVFFLGSYVYYFSKSLVEHNFTIATSAALLLEVTRLLMKMYAFVRSNAPRVLKYKIHSDDEQILYPKLSQYIYFMFAPTLLYRDEYPRTTKIQWKYVLKCAVEFVTTVSLLSMPIEWMGNKLEKFSASPYTFKDFVIITLEIFPAVQIFYVCGFFILLHSWLNGFAELLQFSDRLFYKDWWNSTSIARYLRTWNNVVQDWLYTYVYKDFYEYVCPNNKLVAKLAVISISTIFHEYIMSFMFKFFYPLLGTFFFTTSMMLDYLHFRYNVLFLFFYTIGMAIQVSGYSLEYFARINCPNLNNTISYYFIPQSIFCDR